MRDALVNLFMDDLSFLFATVVGVPRHLRNIFAALNTHVDALFAWAVKVQRHVDSNGQTQPSLLQAVRLRHKSNVLLLLPDGQTPRDHNFPHLKEGSTGTLVENPNALSRHKPRNREQKRDDSKASLPRKVPKMARHFDGIANGARTFTAKKPAPEDECTFAHLQPRHPDEKDEDIADAPAATGANAHACPANDTPADPKWRPEEDTLPDSVRTAMMG